MDIPSLIGVVAVGINILTIGYLLVNHVRAQNEMPAAARDPDDPPHMLQTHAHERLSDLKDTPIPSFWDHPQSLRIGREELPPSKPGEEPISLDCNEEIITNPAMPFTKPEKMLIDLSDEDLGHPCLHLPSGDTVEYRIKPDGSREYQVRPDQMENVVETRWGICGNVRTKIWEGPKSVPKQEVREAIARAAKDLG